MSSPTQRTLAELRKRGAALVQVVEKWNMHAKVRQDLFGIVDVLAVMPKDGGGYDTVAVQATSVDHVSDRAAKLRESDALQVLRLAGWTVLVWGWRKGGRGANALREVDLS